MLNIHNNINNSYNSPYAIELLNISKSYAQGDSKFSVLRNINLKAHFNTKVAIVGASGSGKSSLLHIAGLLDLPDSGAMFLDSIECFNIPNIYNTNKVYKNINNTPSNYKLFERTRLYSIGFVHQQHHLLSNFTAMENIMMPIMIAKKSTHYAQERAEYLLNKVGLYDKKNNMPGELSGGQQQRVAIARSLVHGPKIILADEPTGNLDQKSSDIVCELFQHLIELNNSTLVMVTHNMSIAKSMDKIYELTCSGLQLIN